MQFSRRILSNIALERKHVSLHIPKLKTLRDIASLRIGVRPNARAKRALRALLVPLAAAVGACGGGTTIVIEPDSCQSLMSATLTDVTLSSAQTQAAADGYPKYCKVEGHTLSGRVGFEVRMPFPSVWNGRLLMQGTGGFSGEVDPATGSYRSPTGPGLLANGYSVATSDTGHSGVQRFETYFLPILDGSWARDNPVAQEDFAWRGMQATTVAAQLIVRQFERPDSFRTYYVGCSGAGRIGMKLAEKAPELFDGFAIGDPPVSFSRDMVRMQWNVTTTTALPLSLAKQRLIGRTALARCDALDGAADGIVSDPEACHVNPFELQCVNGDGPDCLTQNEALAAYRIYQGPVDNNGVQVAPGLPTSGGEDCDGLCDGQDSDGLRFKEGWPWWFAGGPPSNLDDYNKPPITLTVDRSFGQVIKNEYFRFMAFVPDPDPDNFHWQELDPVNNISMLDRAQGLYDVQRVDFSDFHANGKRILMYSGWSDALVSPLGLIDYRARVAQASGGEQSVGDVFRLFLVPGMQHCEGGRSLDNFDAVGTLVNWVESGQAPDTMRASSRYSNVFPGRERDLCPYPLVSTYRGSGSLEDPASFQCLQPAR